MSKGNTFENDLLKLIFWGTAIANIADNAASSPLTSLYVSIHTADPGEAGDQSTSECNYSPYARVAVARNSGGTNISGNTVTPVADIAFAAKTGGSDQTATHAMIGTASAGTGKQLYRGPLTPNVNITAGVITNLTTASTVTED
jgi:hypothetical protein